MPQVFISYNSSDYTYAKQIYDILLANNIISWFAPINIFGGQDFASEIGTEIISDENTEERSRHLGKAKALILILSKGSMQSDWVRKEIKLAIKKKLCILPIKVDHEPLTDEFEYLLIDVQIIDGYRLHKNAIKEMLTEVKKHVEIAPVPSGIQERKRISESELHVQRITGGDPYYEEGNTLSVGFTGHEFYLMPPADILSKSNSSLQVWCEENGFVSNDSVFGMSLDEFTREIPIPDLIARIEQSRKKIFLQFYNKENGCYFNNKKYGVEDINPFSRTRDEREIPKLELQMYVTDYFTHRVMKDVCKTLISEGNRYLREIDYTTISVNKIFFTSLGINLLLLEDSLRDNHSTLITSRSTNSAETYKKHNYSLSVIEGVSVSDYDTYQRKIRLTLAVERGLIEELNVNGELLQLNSLKFYDLFINTDNLEIGIFCTIELKKEYGIIDNILDLRGKDEELEISDKKAVPISELDTFIWNNQDRILPQAMYALCSFMANRGVLIIDRFHRDVFQKQSYICSKYGPVEPCGDIVVDSEHYIAIIDGEIPKGEQLWNHMRGDLFVSKILSEAIQNLPPTIDAKSAIEKINDVVRNQYEINGVDYDKLALDEQLQASVLIYNVARREIWSFGTCMLRINQKSYHILNKGETILSDLRAFCIETAKLKKLEIPHEDTCEYGYEKIMPFLKELPLFANSSHSFGYDVINGGNIFKERVKVYAVQPGDHVIMASDGYPKLFDTLKETEEYLQAALREDPNCIGKLRRTKGISKNAVSYDDRSIISFTVE